VKEKPKMLEQQPIRVLALVGSLRAESVNRQLAELAAQTAPDGVAVTIFDGLGDVPFYNEDIDGEPVPAAAAKLRAAAEAADAFLIVTPEYNGSIPAVLKNAIDWLSRPFGAGALKDKPLAVIGSALGHYGGARGHEETRKSSGVAGAQVVVGVNLSLPFSAWGAGHPSDNAEVVASIRAAVEKLVAEVG
jgi:NAD(P)H-dependent FMN reductase